MAQYIIKYVDHCYHYGYIKAIYTRKRTASRDINQPGDISQDCKMEGNPCYETITLRQITTASMHQAPTHDYRVFAGNMTAN